MKTMRTLCLAGVILFLVGCRVPPTKIQFNDRMARDNKALAAAGTAFGRAVADAGKNGGSGSARSRLNDVETTLKKVKDYHEDGLLPIGSSSAQAYKDAYLAFLGSQDKIVGKMRDIVNALDKNQAGQVTALQGEITSLESAAFDKLKTAQKAYCDEHFYKTVEKYNTD